VTTPSARVQVLK